MKNGSNNLPASKHSPFFFLVVIAALIFIIEVFIMLALPLRSFSRPVATFIDAFCLIVLISPALYFLLFRPMKLEIKQRERIEKLLALEKQKMEQVLGIDQRIRSILDLNHLVDFTIEKAADILEAERCSLMLLDPDSQRLLIRGAKGLDDEIIKKSRLRVGEGVAGWVARDGNPLLIEDIETDSRFSRKNGAGYRQKSFMCVPIKIHDELMGVVNVSDKKSRNDGVFTEVDLRILCTIVRQAAISIENANYYRELKYLSQTDSLTGVYNHRFFVKRLDEEIQRAKRYPKPLCLLMMDVDDFKSHNDTHGHLEGDHILKEISKILKGNLRTTDIVCRYGGDEFAAIIPETDIEQVKNIVERIKDAVEHLGLDYKVTVSIGGALYSDGKDRLDFVSKADQALYRAKREGKNRICYI